MKYQKDNFINIFELLFKKIVRTEYNETWWFQEHIYIAHLPFFVTVQKNIL